MLSNLLLLDKGKLTLITQTVIKYADYDIKQKQYMQLWLIEARKFQNPFA